VIDIHCHILPEIDDGARNLEETIEMCRVASADGIRTIVATPHTHDGLYLNRMSHVRRLCKQVNEYLVSVNINITVLPGMEVRVSGDSLADLSRTSLPTLNECDYILFEFPPSQIPNAFDAAVQSALDQGRKIILAHPEKNLAIEHDPAYVFQLLTMFKPWEVIIQITSDCLLGKCGEQAAKTAAILLEHNMAHVIATDAHDPMKRPPILSAGVEVVTRIVGEERARQMVTDIPRALIGKGTFPEYIFPQQPRRWWRVWG